MFSLEFKYGEDDALIVTSNIEITKESVDSAMELLKERVYHQFNIEQEWQRIIREAKERGDLP